MNVKIDATEKKFQTIFALKISQWGIVVLYFSALFYIINIYTDFDLKSWIGNFSTQFHKTTFLITTSVSLKFEFVFLQKKCWFQ